MQITNTTGVDLYVAPLQLVVLAGETVDVDDLIGESLVAQGWTSKAVKRSTTPKAPVADSQED